MAKGQLVVHEEEARLHYQRGTSDKVYHVFLRQVSKRGWWTVEAEYGRRGGRLTSVTRTDRPTDWSTAKALFNRIVGEKLSKGYRLIDDTSSLLQAAAEIEAQRRALAWLLTPKGP